MKEVASGIFRLNQFPRPMINVYLAGDVLFDAGTSWDRRRLTKPLRHRQLSLLALTHVHPDHQGMARELCRTHDIPLACHADDVDAMEGRRPVAPENADAHPLMRLIQDSWTGPSHPVSRVLEDGDAIGEFTVHHTPGHAPGHVVFFRESDRVAICGDVIRNMSYATTRAMLAEPPAIFTYDPAENRRSIRKLAELKPSVLLPGHGPPVTDMTHFQEWVAGLPA